jgi:hypothetical protein
MLIDRCVRQPDGTWNLMTFTGADAVFAFKTIRGKIPLTDIYHGAFNRKRPTTPVPKTPDLQTGAPVRKGSGRTKRK